MLGKRFASLNNSDIYIYSNFYHQSISVTTLIINRCHLNVTSSNLSQNSMWHQKLLQASPNLWLEALK